MTDDLQDSVVLGRGRRGKSQVPFLKNVCLVEARSGQNLAAMLDPDSNKTSLTFLTLGTLADWTLPLQSFPEPGPC